MNALNDSCRSLASPSVFEEVLDGGGALSDREEWAEQKATCPEGKESTGWGEYANEDRGPYVKVRFPTATCQGCPSKHLCTRAKKSGRQLILQAEKQHKALSEIRAKMESEDGKNSTRNEQE